MKVKYKQRNGGYEITYAPERNYNVISLTARFGDSIIETKSELSEINQYGWFPSKVRHTDRKGNLTRRTETLTIEARQINKPLSERDFTFVGMNIPKGERVFDYRSGEYAELQFSGHGLVPYVPEPVELPSEGRWYTKLLIINGVFFAALGLWLVYRARRSHVA